MKEVENPTHPLTVSTLPGFPAPTQSTRLILPFVAVPCASSDPACLSLFHLCSRSEWKYLRQAACSSFSLWALFTCRQALWQAASLLSVPLVLHAFVFVRLCQGSVQNSRLDDTMSVLISQPPLPPPTASRVFHPTLHFAAAATALRCCLSTSPQVYKNNQRHNVYQHRCKK